MLNQGSNRQCHFHHPQATSHLSTKISQISACWWWDTKSICNSTLNNSAQAGSNSSKNIECNLKRNYHQNNNSICYQLEETWNSPKDSIYNPNSFAESFFLENKKHHSFGSNFFIGTITSNKTCVVTTDSSCISIFLCVGTNLLFCFPTPKTGFCLGL